MPLYEWRCENGDCEAEYVVYSAHAYDAPDFIPAPCPVCRGAGERKNFALIAERPAWNPTVSQRFGGDPVQVDTTQHEDELRRRLGKISREEERHRETQGIDPYIRKHYLDEKRAKGREVTEKGKRPEVVGFPTGKRPPYVMPRKKTKRHTEQRRRAVLQAVRGAA